MKLTELYREFFKSEKSGGLLLILCTFISLILANSALQSDYIKFWHFSIANMSLEHIINDGLMAIFFLLIGLELEREIYIGELSKIKDALLPVSGAVGGMLVPAVIFLIFNFGTPTQSGAGIPMATDIAFALAILSLLGKHIPISFKIFLTALAVVDDLGAILVIAIFYTNTVIWLNLIISLSVFVVLLVLNRLKVHNLIPYLIGGIAMWYFMLNSGIHATITGVLLAFAVPFGCGGKKSPSYILQHLLHKPVAFIILPLFALANTAISIGGNWHLGFVQPFSIGIISGLFIGKPLGITVFSFIAVTLGWCNLPSEIKWKHVIGLGFIAGIGFTMSIFITLLAFNDTEIINTTKFMILVTSFFAGGVGFVWLKLTTLTTIETEEQNIT